MKVTLHDPADLPTLRERVRSEGNVKRRDRLRAAEGEDGAEPEGHQIAKRLGRSPRFVDQWLARYRKGGLVAVQPGKARGQKPKLPVESNLFRRKITRSAFILDMGATSWHFLLADYNIAQRCSIDFAARSATDITRRTVCVESR